MAGMDFSGAREWRVAGAIIVLVALVWVSCAKKLPPPGGRPDQDPPRISATRPDSGSTGVPLSGTLEVEFSESMNQRITDDWIFLAPYAKPRKFSWKGKIFRYELAESLRANTTYALIIEEGARDQRGNLIPGGVVSHFTTADSFPPGRLSGDVEGRGHSTRDAYVWGYREDLGHYPDSTARDFDALAITRSEGKFALPGLPVPSVWRLFVFHDVNRNLTFEPGTDHLTESPTLFELTNESVQVDTLHLMSVDPKAPGTLEGVVVDSLVTGLQIGLRVEISSPDGGREVIEVPVADGSFKLPVSSGKFRMWVFLDLDRNGEYNEGTEASSEILEGEISPGMTITGLRLVAPGPGSTPAAEEP
jgi:hypothetical protein